MKAIGVSLVLSVVALSGSGARYEATWESLDARPVPQWWTDAKFGIFVHWGPYSVPAYAPTDEGSVYECYAEWYQGKMLQGKAKFLEHHARHYGKAPYANFAAQFKAENFDADAWADLFRRAGAKYAVLTSKHHDGYALWPSPESPYYNSVVLGSGRDLAGEFTAAMKKAGLRSGFYFSVMEYANPLYVQGDTNVWSLTVNLPQMKELVERYKADIIWPDGEWDRPDAAWHSTEFLSWLYNESSMRDTVVVNDRWGKGCRGRHGGHYTTEYGNVEGESGSGEIMHPWEECRGIGRSFGFNRHETPDHYMSREQCIETLVQTVSAGGNLLLNVGPTADGRIPAIMQDRLLAMGQWLQVNGEAIYATHRSPVRAGEKRVYLTEKGNALYAIDFRRDGKSFRIENAGGVRAVTLLGSSAGVPFSHDGNALVVTPPALAESCAPCQYAWCFRIVRK